MIFSFSSFFLSSQVNHLICVMFPKSSKAARKTKSTHSTCTCPLSSRLINSSILHLHHVVIAVVCRIAGGSLYYTQRLANFGYHHRGEPLLGFFSRATYRPLTANSNVEDHVERGVGKRRPDTCITNVGSRDSVKSHAVLEPLDGLLPPVLGRTVDLQSPVVKVVVGDWHRRPAALGLVARAASVVVLAAVDGSKPFHDAVDLLEDVKLSAHGPVGPVTNRVTQHPEGGPEALAVGSVAHAKTCLPAHLLPGRGRPGVEGLHAGRGPLAVAVLPGDDLQGVPSGELGVVVGVGVFLELAVMIKVHSVLPLFQVKVTAGAALEVIVPDELHAFEAGGLDSQGQRCRHKGIVKDGSFHDDKGVSV